MEEAVKQLTDIPAINRFLSYCRVRTVPSKTALIHAGDLPDVLYYIIRGSVEVMIEDEDGNEMVLAYLNKGQFFGRLKKVPEHPFLIIGDLQYVGGEKTMRTLDEVKALRGQK